MTRQSRLSQKRRESALADLRGNDLARIVEAAKTLSSDPTTTPELVSLLSSETRPEVRQGILYALAWHADLRTWPLMVGVLSDRNETPVVRGQAAEGLSYMFHKVTPGSAEFESGVAALLEALEDPSPEVRYCAVNALGATRHRPLASALQKMLDDHTPAEGWMSTVAEEARRALDALGASKPG